MTNQTRCFPVFLASLIVPIVTWIVVIVAYGLSFDLSSLYEIHTHNFAVIVCDFFPVAAYYFSRNFYKKHNLEVEKLQTELNTCYSKANNSIDIAKKLGEGKFDFEIEAQTDDALATSLKLLRDSLLNADEKEQNLLWISKGKERVSSLLREFHEIDTLSYNILVELINYTGLIQGAFYLWNDEKSVLVNNATYAYNRKKYITQEFKIGKGLIGQAAFEMAPIYKKDLPVDYATITSGLLGEKNPSCVLILPLVTNEKLQGIIEFATLKEDIPQIKIDFLTESCEVIARTIFNLKINLRTEMLLHDAQVMTEELRENEETLHRNAEEMHANQEKIEDTNQHLEQQVLLVENSKKRLYSLLENASEVISIYNPDGTVLYESPSVKNILGYGPDETIGTDGFARVHNSQSEDIQHLFARLLLYPDAQQKIEFQYHKKTGDVVWLESIGRNLLENPAIGGIIFNTRDISERRQIEKEQRKRGQMQALSENSPDIIIRLNLEGVFYYVNPIIEKYTFIPPAKFAHKNINELSLDSDIQNMLWDLLNQIKIQKNKLQVEYTIESLFESKVMQVNAIPEYNEEKEIETILIVAHDITEQKIVEKEIREINKNITESINYAKRIQTSIIPTIAQIQLHLEKSFVLYKPKDTISGDFPWFFTKDENIFIAAVDCTGHGVPGALLSFVGYFLLNNIVDHANGYSTANILDMLTNSVQKTLKQEADKPGSHDGMDIALCKINKTKNTLQYSGAHRTLYLLRNNEVIEYKGDRKPIGGAYVNKKITSGFTLHEINIQKNDRIFFFTDGFPDQYGGPQNKKYTSGKIKEGILSNQDFSFSNYSDYFATEFINWKGGQKQIDDVLMIGIEF